MKHIAEGVLRRMYDDPLAAPEAARAHLHGCAYCRQRFSAVSEDAAFAGRAFSRHPDGIDVPEAFSEFASQAGPDRPAAGKGLGAAAPGKAWLAGAAVVGAVVLSLVVTPAGSSAQQAATTIFAPTSVAPVEVTLPGAGLNEPSGLGAFGAAAGGLKPAADLAAAEHATGLSLTLPPALPAGLNPHATFSTLPSSKRAFTLGQDKIAALGKRYGKTLPPLPSSLDGTTLTVRRGPAIVGVFGPVSSSASSLLVVGKMAAPRVTSTGASLKQLEAYVLSIPGVPEGLRHELEAISNPQSTLPIPVPTKGARSTKVAVQGQSGLLVQGTGMPMSAVIWERQGALYAVAGTVSARDLIQVASGVR